MPRKTVSREIWDEIARHWRIGHLTVIDIARRYNLNTSSIYARAKREHWPPRETPRDDPASAREALLADLTFELRQSLSRLRAEPPADTPAAARDRTRLIREYQRTLAALVVRPVRIEPTAPESAPLDLEEAERIVLARLARLDTAPETPPRDDPADAAPLDPARPPPAVPA